MEEDNNSLKQTKKIKYKPSKIGKIALGAAIASLSAGLLSLILSALSIISGYFMLIVSIASYIIAMLATLFLIIDIARFNKIHNINENSDNKMMIGLVIGIAIGFMWGKIL
ncbi:hypothetical protein [Anaerocolumna xylanovorans]|uniref:Uncharacterized protein n=1 Tax=Anaerocolumna xylanovorans DSM 12503 TaxID=1121345 RepID=A0A1M7YH34_9FIRM|nr:hypothetical protein [Anaerocolumna xylanovorans]SHO51889.1 hypothetical protein SAMN02745217_03388 [Anaerocolumna xylanovorans DSM 12503]